LSSSPTPDPKANLRITREGGYLADRLRTYRVILDKKKVATIHEAESEELELTPGTHISNGPLDNRWRPGLESSRRRVQEEERDDAGQPVIYSRELSFVPARRKVFEAHDAQTRVLIRRIAELERLRHGPQVRELLEKWQWTDQMNTPEEKQRFLEPSIEQVRRDPERNEHLLIFLMLAFEPVRRSVSKAFVSAHFGMAPQARDANLANREEARMIHHIE
jgi:hypothetical protein